MTKLKVCGITREEDARFCAEAGVDFIGLVFVPESPRFVARERAARIVRSVESGTRPKVVGVFRNAPTALVSEIAQSVALDLVQLHGSESDEAVRDARVPVIRAIGVGDAPPDTAVAPGAAWLLFDAKLGGGAGRTFDWSLLEGVDRRRPFFLAGGLGPANVEEAIRAVRPDAVDVSTGVESAPGIKDHRRIRQMIERVRR